MVCVGCVYVGGGSGKRRESIRNWSGRIRKKINLFDSVFIVSHGHIKFFLWTSLRVLRDRGS